MYYNAINFVSMSWRVSCGIKNDFALYVPNCRAYRGQSGFQVKLDRMDPRWNTNLAALMILRNLMNISNVLIHIFEFLSKGVAGSPGPPGLPGPPGKPVRMNVWN